jgi:hypothetical protein
VRVWWSRKRRKEYEGSAWSGEEAYLCRWWGGGNVGTRGGIRREGRRVMFYETGSGLEEVGIRGEAGRSKFLLMLF